MAKVYIIALNNYEYNDEYFYIAGDLSPNGYYSSKKAAYEDLVERHRIEYTHADTLAEFTIDNEDLCSDRENLRIDLADILSFIDVPDFDPDNPNYEWIPKTLTIEETKVLMKYMINFGTVMELQKNE